MDMIIFYFMSMHVSFERVSVYLISAVTVEVRSWHWIHGSGVIEGYELLCQCWEVILGPLEEQPVLLTTESSLQLPLNIFLFILEVMADEVLYLTPRVTDISKQIYPQSSYWISLHCNAYVNLPFTESKKNSSEICGFLNL